MRAAAALISAVLIASPAVRAQASNQGETIETTEVRGHVLGEPFGDFIRIEHLESALNECQNAVPKMVKDPVFPNRIPPHPVYPESMPLCPNIKEAATSPDI